MMQRGKPTRFYSNRQEKAVAKAVGGKQVSNSGAIRFGGGDVRTDSVLIECKTCTAEKKSFSIKREWIEKNQEEAFAMGKHYSALAFNFGDDVNYYVVSEKIFKEWLNSLDKQ